VTAEVDRPKIAQVTRNLVSNALKFTPRGGTVTVTTRRERTVEKEGEKEGERWFTVEVVDTGVGIEAVSIEPMPELYYCFESSRHTT
jgi:signal transduction histidine kinase